MIGTPAIRWEPSATHGNRSSFRCDPPATDPERVGPKAANLAGCSHVPACRRRAGSASPPTPTGIRLRHLGIERPVDGNSANADRWRRAGSRSRSGSALYERPIAPEILEPLLAAWRTQRETASGPGAVRSSALIEDREGANFAGQFESFLGVADETEFLTAVRACWAALWTIACAPLHGQPRPQPGRHRDGGADPADCRGARVRRRPERDRRGQMLISATWGLGSAIAQGEVVPDRIVLSAPGLRAQGRGRPQGSSRHLRPRRHRAARRCRTTWCASHASTPGRR